MQIWKCILFAGKKLFPGNGFDFQFYMHSTGISKPIFSSFVSLEEQVDRLIPLFKDVMIPLMPANDSLLEFLHKEEQLLQCVTKIFNGQPRMTDINELVYAYLSLGQHRINGRIHIGGHAFCENQQDALCICSQGRTDSSCQAGPVSQNQIR